MWDRPSEILQELCRILKPGGYLALELEYTDKNVYMGYTPVMDEDPEKISYLAESIRDTIRYAGKKVDNEIIWDINREYHLYKPWLVIFARRGEYDEKIMKDRYDTISGYYKYYKEEHGTIDEQEDESVGDDNE